MMQPETNQENEMKKPKTWDEAILELKGFILNAKKEEARQKAAEKAECEEKES